MSSEWTDFTFDQLKAPSRSAFAMGPFGSNIKAENFVTSGVPVIKGGNLNGTYLTDSFSDFLSQKKADQLASSKARPLDLVITHRGTLGQVGLIPENANFPEYIVSQSQLKLSFDRALVDPHFIYYFLRSPLGQQRLLANKSQVGVPAIAQALTTIRQIRINLPSLKLQREISNLLRALDNRITLLRETNKTIEAIAQAIFKSWFVDFDPVRAKTEDRQPEGMDEKTAALFPDEFEESELGLVPKGWRPVTLGSFIELAYGKALRADTRVAGNVPVYGSGGITGWHNNALITEPSVIVGRKGTVGSLYWESRPFFPIDTVFYVKTKKPLVYVHELLKHLPLRDMNTDAAVPGLNRENVYRLLTPLPPDAVLYAFKTIAAGLRKSIDHNNAQAHLLEHLRDTLLPRLISGRLPLPEPDVLVAEHA